MRLPGLRHHRAAWPASLGAGDLRGALAQGIDGVWLAVADRRGRHRRRRRCSPARWSTLFGAGADGRPATPTTYLRIAFLGTVPLLVMLAATGVLRGLQDTRTPLVVAVGRQRCSTSCSTWLLVYGVGLGIAGSALGIGARPGRVSAAAFVVVVVRAARRAGRPAAPGPARHPRAPRTPASPLVVRTLTLRAALLVTTYAVALAPSAARQASTSPPTSWR